MLRRTFIFKVKAPHAVLGLPANATEDQVKTKYKELARRLHPDMPGGSERKFQELNAAYNILKMRAQARAGKASGKGGQARTMNMYRGEDDKADGGEDFGEGGNKWRSYVDEEEEAELRAQERAAEEMRKMSSQTFNEMMWTMSTYELVISAACLCAA